MKIVKGEFGKKTKKAIAAFSMAPEMAENEYQSSEFFVPSKDSQGHSVKITTMITPDVKREIQTILSRRAIPLWDTEGDLIRWCIHFGLVALAKRIKDPHVQSAHAVMNSWAEIQREMAEADYWGTTVFPTLRQKLVHMIKKGDYIPARRLLRVVERMIANIGDDYWRQKFEKEVVEYYAWVKVKAKSQEMKLKREKDE